jgi:hypothetical protein
MEWGMVEKNPALGIKQFNEDNKVEHYLDDEELERWCLCCVLTIH